MSSVVFALRPWSRAAALAAIALGAVACSSEATRFTNPFSSQPSRSEATGSTPPQKAPAGRVQTTALPPPGGSQPAPMAGGVSGGGRGMASYQPGMAADPVTTGSVQSPSSQPGYGPPPAPPARRHVAAPPRSAPSAPAAGQRIHVVAPGETLIRISRQYSMPLAELARYNNIPPHTKLNIGDQIRIPAGRTSRNAKPETQKVAQPKALSAPPKAKLEAKALPKGQPKTVAAVPAPVSVGVATPSADAAEPETQSPVRSANAGFRWPAKGRIIAGFGPKTNGQTNDGVNIALPEGTPIKAAADGTVAYAGNELKGYGNLVLVRHADGYVTAYAHAKELMVRRGDTVRRGQTIAKSGQTGNVDTPQLHFEIRKGPAPIDPMPLLSGG